MNKYTIALDARLPAHYRVVENGQKYVSAARPYEVAESLCTMLNDLDKERKAKVRKENSVRILAVIVVTAMAIWWGAAGFPGDADTFAMNHDAEVRD